MTRSAEVLVLAAFLVAARPSDARARAVAYQIDEAHTGYIPATLRPPLTRSWAVDLGGSVSYDRLGSVERTPRGPGVEPPRRLPVSGPPRSRGH